MTRSFQKCNSLLSFARPYLHKNSHEDPLNTLGVWSSRKPKVIENILKMGPLKILDILYTEYDPELSENVCIFA